MMLNSIDDYLLHARPDDLRALELVCRLVLNQLAAGQHQSRRSGQGQDFRQYRAYQPGDDPRLIDWKMYARSDRYFIRDTESTRQLQVYIVADASASALHQDSRKVSRWRYICLLAAATAWIASAQGDAVGLYTGHATQWQGTPAQNGNAHLKRIFYQLMQTLPEGSFPDRMQQAAMPLIPAGRHLIIFISDLWEHQEEISHWLVQQRSRKHEVICWHLLADNELELPQTSHLVLQDLEKGQKVYPDSQSRALYHHKIRQWLQKSRNSMATHGTDYELLSQSGQLLPLLSQFLRRRSQLKP